MKNIRSFYTGLLSLIWLSLFCTSSSATNIAQYPLFLTSGAPPIVMLTMGRDHKLYYEAYNDSSDINGDGELDIRYKPTEIDYFGYFDSYKCYNYSSGTFTPTSVTATKQCSGNWSGDFLNYLTTSRMDALRKVLYGGYRSTDSTSTTKLERVFVPQDAHSWGKEYTSVAVDGYDISDYTPLSLPTGGNRHLFASTTMSDGGDPVLRVLQNKSQHTWDWLSKERPVADNSLGTPTEYVVRVTVCVTGLLEGNCKAYSDGSTTIYKPTGILQRYGDDELMAFGLLTGSYYNNTHGGVLRKNISTFQDEVDLDTGIFTNTSGIVDTIDKLRIARFNYGSKSYDSGWITDRTINTGVDASNNPYEHEAQDWGNPIAELMYESLRYFAGKNTPTTVFSNGVSGGSTEDTALGLPLPSWQDPYRVSGGYESCAKPIQMVISDINSSYDTDEVPGSSFNSFTGDLTGLNVSTLADTIWAGETEATNVFIGESNGSSDGSPSAKTVNSFKNIRGLAPEEPTKLGGYYAGSIAKYGKDTDLHDVDGDQTVDTIAVALASPLPRIEIPVAGKTVTIVPFAKSVGGGYGINAAQGQFQPTNQIVDFYVETIANTGPGNVDAGENSGRPYGKFRINYEDVEQAADHDMDAIVEYEFSVNATNQVVVTLNSTYAAGGIIQHMGYVISGTTADGTYLEVRDIDTGAGSDPDYFLDTPPGQLPGGVWNDSTALPITATRTFNVGSSTSASFIKHDPLWYAAKWSMTDKDENGTLESDEWDSDGDGDPDGYFLVTNAGTLEEQLNKAFEEIVSRTSSAAAVATNSTRLDTNTKIYQARFNSSDWSGQLLAFDINDSDGTIGSQVWNAATLIPTEDSRNIFTYNPLATGNKGIEFEYGNLNTTQQSLLDKDAAGTADGLGDDRDDYIRGDQTKEQSQSAGVFRDRTSLLGDIINSDPWFVSRSEDFGYSSLEGTEGSSYITFRDNKKNRTPALYFGANDGMFHAINADDGNELFTYIPESLIGSLSKLTSPLYGCTGDSGCLSHTYYVDGAPKAGDAYIDTGSGVAWRTVVLGTLGAGGKGLFALDVSKPNPATIGGFDATDILWEISTLQSPDNIDLSDFQSDLGYTLPQASIVRMHNGKWAAIVANGYDSTDNKAVLFIIDIEDGSIIKMFDTKVGSGSSPNGMSTPITADLDGDRIADVIYAGDLQGNLWKIDVSASNSNNWDFAFKTGNTPNPLFIATDSGGTTQAITAKPQVGDHPDGGIMVYFGTGQYFAVNDEVVGSSPQVHSFYGIRDQGTVVSSRSALQQQSILFETTLSSLNLDVRVVSDTVVTYPSKKGWYMDLLSPVNGAEGERVVSGPLLRAGRIIFTTLIPESDPCGWGGTSWLMELDAVYGNRLDQSPFDVNEDGNFDISDFLVTLDTDGDGDVDGDDEVPVSGIRKHDVGIIKTPGVISTGNDTEVKYVSGSSGNLEIFFESAGDPSGRQSWRQLR
jgi:type IV pilus assembly protein PilY1